jgi:tetratricopeptide (TPR) repeat protein
MRQLLATILLFIVMAVPTFAAKKAPSAAKTTPSAASDWATCAKATGDESIAACSRLIQSGERKGNELAAVHVNRCTAFDRKGDYDRAIPDCNEAIRLNPKSSSAFVSRCWAWQYKGDLERATEDCSEAIRINPEDSFAYTNRCAAWIRKNDFDRALPDCNEAIRLNKRNATAYSNRCSVWNNKNEPDRALGDCDEAIHLNPAYAIAYGNRCSAWIRKNNPDRAIPECNEAIRLDPKYALAYSNRCASWNQKKEPDRAISDCDEAIRLDPKFPKAYYGRGNAWREKGDYNRAIADYAESIRLDPKFVFAYSNRGLLYEQLADYDNALADFRAIVAIDPQHPNASERVRRVEQRREGLAAPPPPRVGTTRPPETRVALVIGNSSYPNVGRLPNAARDAELIAEAFRRSGFTTVSLSLDLSRERITEALKTFAVEADRADWAVVYYAGHGIEFGGTNYLIPTDARLASDRDISIEAVALEQVLLAVEGAQKLRLVILDACRDNPFAKTMRRSTATRSIGRGLARVEPEGATLVVYAARDGQVALDGGGVNSPFADALAKHLATPGLEINLLFRKVRDDVLNVTGRKQEPFVYGSLPAAEFYFRKP